MLTLDRRLRVQTGARNHPGRWPCPLPEPGSPRTELAHQFSSWGCGATNSIVHHLLGRAPDPPRADQVGVVLVAVHGCWRRSGWCCGGTVGWARAVEGLKRQLSRVKEKVTEVRKAAGQSCLACMTRARASRRASELPRHGTWTRPSPPGTMASANDIPNLRTLLGPRRGGPSRGRGRGRGGIAASSEEKEQLRDNAVKGTDQDAAGSRVSCVELGYLHDPYAKLFATQQATRRLPLLNRGKRPELQHAREYTHGNRNLCSHLCSRPSSHPVPAGRSYGCEANRLPWCRHRYSLLPSARPSPRG